jgi:hypothetical protein
MLFLMLFWTVVSPAFLFFVLFIVDSGNSTLSLSILSFGNVSIVYPLSLFFRKLNLFFLYSITVSITNVRKIVLIRRGLTVFLYSVVLVFALFRNSSNL